MKNNSVPDTWYLFLPGKKGLVCGKAWWCIYDAVGLFMSLSKGIMYLSGHFEQKKNQAATASKIKIGHLIYALKAGFLSTFKCVILLLQLNVNLF